MFKSLSLPARLSLAVMSVLVVTTVLADYMAVRELRRHLAVSMSDSLSAMVNRMAKQMDRDIVTLRELLAGEAKMLEGLSGAEADRVLRQQGATLDFAFDRGVVMIDAAGKVLADSRNRDIWADTNLSDREFFQRTFALGQPIISLPFRAEIEGRPPLIVFTAPLRDASGRMRAMLAGAIDLVDNRILAQPTGMRTSRFGQIGVFTLDGQVVSHSEKSLILDEFENPLPDLRQTGEKPDVTEVTATDGTPAVLAAARLGEADWIIAGVFPSEELYRPIEKGFAAAHRRFAAGLAICCLLVLLVSRKTVRDLDLLAREVQDIGGHGAVKTGDRVGARHRGEAGVLASSINSMLDSLEAAHGDIDELSSRLAGAEENERRIIAADLHDSVCQTLALANMRLGGLKKRLPDAATADEVTAVRTLLEQSVAQLKTLIFNLSPGILYELGLAPALEWYAGEFSKKHGLAVTATVDGSMDGLDDERAIFLYRAAGELLTNAAKHAQASAVVLRIGREEEANAVRLTVEDNGRGLPGDWADGAGFGLRSLRTRVRQFHGGMEARPGPGGGTAVTITVPLPRMRE